MEVTGAISMRSLKKFVSYSVACACLSNLSMLCHIRTYITHDPNIVLLGDDHALYQHKIKPDPVQYMLRLKAEIDHLKQILRQISGEKRACIVLAEDYLGEIHKKLSSLNPDDMKQTLLHGLVQRVNALKLENIRAIGIDRGPLLSRAAGITEWDINSERWPSFEDLNPAKINEKQPNAYTIRFSDLIDETSQLKRELLSRHKPEYAENVHNFIDAKAREIDEKLLWLQKILNDQQVKTSESILTTIVRWWVLRTMMYHPDKIAEIQSVGRGLEDFGSDYKKGMSSQEWTERTVDLKDRCRQLFEEEQQPIMQKPSLTAQFFRGLASMLCVRNWFSSKPAIRSESPGCELTALSDPSLSFRNQTNELNACLFQLRFLVVDSHATLDIIDHPEAERIVIGGDDHIKNISKYLTAFGFAQTNHIVRHRSKNEEPLDLCALPI